MRKKIGLIGIPIEEVPINDTDYLACISKYIPEVTSPVRKQILELTAGLNIEDLGEAVVGEPYELTMKVDRLEGMPYIFSQKVSNSEIKMIEKERKRILKTSKEFDLLIAIGPSHLGAITLYEKKDRVARLDYHSDYINIDENISYNYASYMDWVAENIKNITVENYFNTSKEFEHYFGKNIEDFLYGQFTRANHFDIDVDCFDKKYQIQNIYPHESGSTGASPDIVLLMIKKAKPKKLGIWEYRPQGDYQGNGLKFIVDAIKTAAK
ncbi:MAG: hypothetical protein ABIB43_04615 [archaeon]